MKVTAPKHENDQDMCTQNRITSKKLKRIRENDSLARLQVFSGKVFTWEMSRGELCPLCFPGERDSSFVPSNFSTISFKDLLIPFVFTRPGNPDTKTPRMRTKTTSDPFHELPCAAFLPCAWPSPINPSLLSRASPILEYPSATGLLMDERPILPDITRHICLFCLASSPKKKNFFLLPFFLSSKPICTSFANRITLLLRKRACLGVQFRLDCLLQEELFSRFPREEKTDGCPDFFHQGYEKMGLLANDSWMMRFQCHNSNETNFMSSSSLHLPKPL